MDGTSLNELSADRISNCLADGGHNVRIAAVRATPIGTGQMAGSYRVELTFDGDPGDVPTSLVAKIPVGPPEQRALAANSYIAEVDFYTDVAPLLNARLPRCWGAWRNDGGDDFLLLLEDLAPRVPGDQIAGCSIDQATSAVRNLAGVHGPVWGDPRLESLLSSVGAPEIEGTDAVFGALTDLFLGQNGDRITAKTAEVCRGFAPLAGRFLTAQADRVGIVHGDYRLDNLMFAPDASDVAVVDWQTVGRGLPARDLAYFLGTSLEPDDRRKHEDDLIATYHDGLVAQGVADYDLEACRGDYAFGMFQIPLSVMFGSAIATGTTRGADMFAVMSERGAAAMADHGTLDLV